MSSSKKQSKKSEKEKDLVQELSNTMVEGIVHFLGYLNAIKEITERSICVRTIWLPSPSSFEKS
jgi:ssRNA-specific RNase YbeY (16S rRNA maturation enzyme)